MYENNWLCRNTYIHTQTRKSIIVIGDVVNLFLKFNTKIGSDEFAFELDGFALSSMYGVRWTDNNVFLCYSF